MKKKLIIELVWLAGIFVVSYLLFEFVAGNSALDINMHDTYIVGGVFGPNLSWPYFFFAYFITVGFGIYLIRVTYFSFSVIHTDIILLVFTGLFLCFLGDVIFIFHPSVLEAHLTDLSAPVKGLFYGGSYSNSHIWATYIIKVLLMLILSFTGFMIGKNWDKSMLK
jgi:hypothetical protein